MLLLQYELSVLAKALEYKNLTIASHHVGLSQPQLSRIIKKLESELSIQLLNRESKRNATWTKEAKLLGNIVEKNSKQLFQDLEKLQEHKLPRLIRVGCLEGMIPFVIQHMKKLITKKVIRVLELDVEDLDRLEDRFIQGELDLIYTSREPEKKKTKFTKNLGYQTFQSVAKSQEYQILSSFEFQKEFKRMVRGHMERPTLVSNSLQVRKILLDQFGGLGNIPSEVQKQKKSEDDTPVLLYAKSDFEEEVWNLL